MAHIATSANSIVSRNLKDNKFKIVMVSESARYYQEHPLARKRKAMYDSKFESSPSQKKKRRELAKFNAAHDKKYGAASRKGMDASHTKSGIRYKPSSVNRGSKTDMAGDRRARGGC